MNPEPNVDKWTVKLSLFLIGIGAASMLLIKPIIVGGLIDTFGYTPSQAGIVASVEMAGVGVGTLIVVIFGSTWNGRWIATIGALIAVLSSIGPSLFSDFATVVAFRLFAGIGCGVLVSVVIAAIAATHDPDRSFSLYYAATSIAALALFPTAAALVASFGVRAAYALLAALVVPTFALLFSVPIRRVQKEEHLKGMAGFPLRHAFYSLAPSVIYWSGTGAVWAFMERIAKSTGLNESDIGTILAASQVTFILGAMSASYLHTRVGRLRPALGGALMSILALGLIAYGGSTLLFCCGVAIFTFAWMFFFPYMTGTMAALDSSGRIAVLGVPSQTLGLAIGPAIGGYLANSGDYNKVVLFGAVAYAVAIIAFLPALMTADRQKTMPSDAGA